MKDDTIFWKQTCWHIQIRLHVSDCVQDRLRSAAAVLAALLGLRHQQ